MSARPWDRGASRKHVLDALRALDDVLRAGKARRGGCSNYAAWQVARALGRSGAQGLAADRKARLDEMTRGHRSGDDP